MGNYEDYYVAFLDILGFKNFINTKCFQEVKNIFIKIAEGKEAKFALYKACNENDAEMYQYNRALDAVLVKTMSDSIIIACPSNYKEALTVVIDMCWMIQCYLYECSTPMLLRGGVAKGEFYCEDEVMFGKGMIDAYLLQEEKAIYPRIILDSNIMNEPLIMDSILITEDYKLRVSEEGVYFVNCLYQYLDSPAKEIIMRKFRKMNILIKENLETYTDIKIGKKYIWLQKELNKCMEVILK